MIMIDLVKIFVIGAVQGVTEFLPVSSTGHLILLEKIFNISQSTYGLAFDAALHLGTLLAVLWFFRKSWLWLITSLYRNIVVKTDIDREASDLLKLIIIGTIPGAIFGIMLESNIETVFRSPVLVALALIIFSFVLIYIEKISQKNKQIKDMNWKDGLMTGLAQAIALIPGVSRSGITIAAGMWEGLTRAEAARFAFLISAPIIAGAGGKKLLDTILLVINRQLQLADIGLYIIGMLTAAVFGYLTIKYFLQYLSRNSLMPFIIYRLVLGFLILVLIFLN